MSDAPKEPEPGQLRNTLYRKVTRGKRRLTPARLHVYRNAVFLGCDVGDKLRLASWPNEEGA